MEHMVSSWTNQLDPWLTLLKVSAPFFFTSLVLLGSLFYFYEPYWKVRKVPGPSVTPVLGHLPLLARHGPDIFGVLARKYGPIYRFHMGRQPLVIVANAELCKEVGIKKFKDICNRSIPSPISASPLHQKGLFFTRDSIWSTMRKTILALYQPTYLAGLVPTMQSIIQSATHDLTTHGENEEICFSDFSLKLATDIIGKAAFGVEFNLSNGKSCSESEVSDFINQHIYSTTSLKMDLTASFSTILGNFIPFLQDPVRKILTCVPGSADRRIGLTNWNLCERMNEIVENRSKTGSKGHKDFLSEILNARESGRVSKDLFTTDSVSALAYEHLLAGSATTAFTLSSIVYLVAAHPQVEEKLLLEIDSFGPPGHEPTSEDLCKFPYLDQVIKEAMRYYTVSPLVARETSKEVEVAGYMLPKGTWIWLAVGVLAKDPKYFPQPEKFRPERFDPYCEEEKQRHPYAYIPFGIGPRACVGSKFALQEIKLTLIHLYQRYVFRHSPCMENPLALAYGIVLNFKHGVWLRVVKRATAA